MTGTDRTDEWERIARETMWQSLTRLGDDTARTTDEVADAVYWGHDLDAEQVERVRQAAFDLQYAAEAYLARLCEETEPWPDGERTPSWHPAESGGNSHCGPTDRSVDDPQGNDPDTVDTITDVPSTDPSPADSPTDD